MSRKAAETPHLNGVQMQISNKSWWPIFALVFICISFHTRVILSLSIIKIDLQDLFVNAD